MLTNDEHEALKSGCAVLSVGPDYRDKDYVRNILTTALDFQLNVATVNRALAHYRENLWSTIRTHDDIVKFLNSYQNSKNGNLDAARIIWGNKCWTRVEFLRAIIAYCTVKEIKDIKKLRKWAMK